jgi:hypothetical protein
MLLEEAGFGFVGVHSSTKLWSCFALEMCHERHENRDRNEATAQGSDHYCVRIRLVARLGSLLHTWFQKGKIQAEDGVREVQRLIKRSTDTSQNATR